DHTRPCNEADLDSANAFIGKSDDNAWLTSLRNGPPHFLCTQFVTARRHTIENEGSVRSRDGFSTIRCCGTFTDGHGGDWPSRSLAADHSSNLSCRRSSRLSHRQSRAQQNRSQDGEMKAP